MKKLFKPLASGLVCLYLFSGCAAILMPKKQKLTINSNNAKSSVYLNNEEIGTGPAFTTKVKRDGVQQVVTQTPGYKDEYNVLIPERRSPAFFPLRILSFACFFVPGYYETLLIYGMDKKYAYAKANDFSNKTKYVTRDDKKYIDLEAIKLDIKNVKKDIDLISVSYKKDMNTAYKEAEASYEKSKAKKSLKEAKSRKKKGKQLVTENDPNTVKYDDTKFSVNVMKTLKKSGFVDTVNQIFQDDMNTLNVMGIIRNVKIYNISKFEYTYNTARLKIVWQVRNNYGEVMDSIVREDMSGDFYLPSSYGDNSKYENAIETMFADAVDISFQKLLADKKFQKYLTAETYKNPYSTSLTIPTPKSVVEAVEDATDASVIIKRKDKGHGSGFAISNNGYIITNYHVIAGESADKLTDFTVVLSNGTEEKAKVIRTNKAKDLALLKVEANFEKAFKVSGTKSFKKLQEVYCVGTPKSIELGQTVSLGILSNERNMNNNSMLQLSMSINAGNSGGPLFGKNGALHGIIQSKLVGFATEGISFAIPSYMLPEYLNIKYQ